MPMVAQAPSNCPPGLEYLTQIDQLIVKQQIEILEGVDCYSNARLDNLML